MGLVDCREVVHIDEEDSDAHDVVERATGGVENGPDVLERAGRLRADAAFYETAGAWVLSDLTLR